MRAPTFYMCGICLNSYASQEQADRCNKRCSEAKKPAALSHQIGGDHYRSKTIQPIEFMLANGLGFCEGNVVKYVTRWKDKGGLADLKKARHYLDFLIEHEEARMCSTPSGTSHDGME